MTTTRPQPIDDFNAWFQAFLQPTVLTELAVLAGMVLVAFGIAWAVRRALKLQDASGSVLFGRRLVDGVLFPLLLLLLGIYGYYEAMRRVFRATRCEATLSVFVLVFAGFVLLTVIGVLFRGAGMQLMFPWDITTVH